MEYYVLTFVLSLLAAVIVMVVHEIVKSIVYFIYKKKNDEYVQVGELLKIWKYIDPIGLLLCLTNYAVFSKQHPFLIRSRKAAIWIGLSGLISLVLLALCGGIVYKSMFVSVLKIGTKVALTKKQFYIASFLKYIVYYSCLMFLVNLFPIASFDLSVIVAGCIPELFVNIRKFDAAFKLLFVILLILGVYNALGIFISTVVLM